MENNLKNLESEKQELVFNHAYGQESIKKLNQEIKLQNDTMKALRGEINDY